ncbi:Uncharacterised protein [Mycobacteroides abscessus subsp. abscessus]|nr:Uncharacterised protein [Mycobacteroides abscessus subsp. abscessus]SIN14537.1 Uncharacterised protein [Mycobacteroides abscessus subsp. abscessus]
MDSDSEKAFIGASYRAALNAGGQHNDWKLWYAEQLAQIQPNTTVEEVLERPFAPWFTRLPKFWTEPETADTRISPDLHGLVLCCNLCEAHRLDACDDKGGVR